jgi:hypothetical protein
MDQTFGLEVFARFEILPVNYDPIRGHALLYPYGFRKQ